MNCQLTLVLVIIIFACYANSSASLRKRKAELVRLENNHNPISVRLRRALKAQEDDDDDSSERGGGRDASKKSANKSEKSADVDDDFKAAFLDALPKHKVGEVYLPDNYNKLELPLADCGEDDDDDEDTDKKVPVKMGLDILSIKDIDELNEQISFDVDMTIEWRDGAIFCHTIVKALQEIFMEDGATGNIGEEKLKTLDPEFLKKIWKPDIYIENLIKVNQPHLLTKTSRLRIDTSLGRMVYTSRIHVTIHCDLDFQYYPADTQKCDVILGSFSYNSTELELKWSRPGIYLQDASDDNFDLAVGSLRRFQYTTETGETFDALMFTWSARRKLSYHMLQTYPSRQS